jgi:hypothetical protein
MGESGWRVHLLDGPFDGEKRELLAAGWLPSPPSYVEVYVCPCCQAVAVLEPEDPRCDELVKYGAGPGVLYVFEESEERPSRWAHYRFIETKALAVSEEDELAVA